MNMNEYCSSSSKMSFQHDNSSDDDSDYNERDPGREVIEKNIRNRLQRIADHTKDELNKVLKRVDNTLNHYEYSLQSSLIQHGMTSDDMSNVEHVADIKELEALLNDSLAKQRYKQRLMIFIVGQTEQAGEKAKLLQQIGQFFHEQKQSFSGKEFDSNDDINEAPDEIDKALKSFDVKDCFIHVKTLGTRLNELNEEIIQYLIQNAGTKQQAKGKKKLAQVAKETKEQLNSLQSKLELANTEMINKDNQIETLRTETKINEDKIQKHEKDIEYYKNHINGLDDDIQQYKNQIEDLTKTITILQQSQIENATDSKPVDPVTADDDKSEETIVPNQEENPDKEIQISYQNFQSENNEDLNLLLNATDGIDLNNITNENLPNAFNHLQNLALVRIRELLKELEIKESINNEIVEKFDEYKKTCEQDESILIEKADNAYQLQIKAQRTAEEAMNHLQVYMAEHEKLRPDLFHQETQTDEEEISENITSSSEYINPIQEPLNDQLSSHSKTTEEFESIENFRRTSLKDKYISLIEEKKQELDQLKQQAEIILSRPTSIRERLSLQSLENSAVLIKQQPSISSFDSNDEKENQPDIELILKQDQEQQTSPMITSRRSSLTKENIVTQMIQIDEYKLPFYHLYEVVFKFRHAIINLLEQYKFSSLANCLEMVKQLSSDENNNLTNDFIQNVERVFKDIVKVLQTCLTPIKEKEIIKEPSPEPIIEISETDNQQSLIIDQKESIIIDLTTKYEHLMKVLNETNKKYEIEFNQNQRLIHEQQKLIQNLQQELFRVQKRLAKIEYEGIVEPSIMFTRLDLERNEQALQQAVNKGKVPETTYNELNEVMTDYVELPTQQLGNLVKRYIQFRKATELEDRIQSEIIDNDTKNVLEKMEGLYERRSDQISKRMSNIRQQRANLARILTEKFDNLEDERSVFLIRPVYSYQGRAATQSYMKQERRRREAIISENLSTKKHHTSRQSIKTYSATKKQDENQQVLTPLSSFSTSDDEERFFHIGKSVPSPRPSLIEQSNDSTTDPKQVTIQLNELTRLQELDIQRALLPMSHSNARLLSAFTHNGIDPCVPSLNLRSYVALSRPGISRIRIEKSNDIITPVSREGLSALSAKSQPSNPRTPVNSSAGDLRRSGPPLPPIRRSLTSSVTPKINEKQHSAFISSIKTNEISTTD